MEQDPQLSALYRAGADAAPPAHLDDAIRAAARREVAAGPRRSSARRWAVPVSLAAVVVLSVSVVTMMREQGADRLESVIAPPPEIPAVTVQREVAEPPVVTAPEAAPPRRSALPPPASAPAGPAEPSAKAAVSAPAQTFGRATEVDQGMATAGSESRAKAAIADTTRSEDSGVRRENTSPQPQLRSAPAPMADAASGAGASVSAKPAAPAAALSSAPLRSTLWQDLVRESTEKWVQRIIELRRAGQTADAEALAAEFRRRFPDQRLPEDLR
jgi:hypothetical protein